MKTPEQMAEEYLRYENESYYWAKHAFLAGYQAAKDQLADADKVMGELSRAFDQGYQSAKAHYQTDWISVKERLPEIGEHGYSKDVLLLSEVGRMEVSHIEKVKRVVKWRGIEPVIETENGTPIEYFTHWMPLPEAPKGEG